MAWEHTERPHGEQTTGGGAGASATHLAELLSETHEGYRSIVEGIPAITYVETCAGGTGTALYVSPQVRPLLGFTAEAWLEDHDFRWRHAHPDDRDRVARLHRAAREGQAYEAEYRMIARDGRKVWFQDRAMPVRDERGRVVTCGA